MQNDRPWITHYDPGVPSSIHYPNQLLQAFLENSALKYGERACATQGDCAITYQEMNELADAIAAGLQSMGVRKGDRIGILMPNVPQFVIAFYGILKAGAVVVATNPLYTSAEIIHQMTDAGVEFAFVASEVYETMRPVRAQTNIRSVIVSTPEDLTAHGSNQGGAPEKPPLRALSLDGVDTWMRDLFARMRGLAPTGVQTTPDDTALFQYSGGTTGISKAAIASHRGVVANTLQFRHWLVTLQEAQETMLMAIPLYHAYGMIAGMSLGIAIGATLALVPNARDTVQLLSTIDRFHPTVFPGVPALYNALSIHSDVGSGHVSLASMRVCISGSTALMRQTKERFEQLSGGTICEGYGLSEAPVVTHCNPLLGTNKIGSIGMPMPDVECRIVDLDAGEKDVEDGQSGELVLRGPQLMKGYHNMPDETAATLRTLGDGKTWLFTGDIVRMDEEGYFFVVDRKKELIKPGGFQVWPREVEEVLSAHPMVLEAGVAGVPDPEAGEAVRAWVVLRPGSQATAEEIRSWCRERLASYKVPSQIEFRNGLPKSNVGKVLRRELVREYLALTGTDT